MKKILVYGSLRKGEYNFDRFVKFFGEKAIKHIETTEIEGFDLYSLGPYPGIKEGKNKLIVDVLEVTDEVHDSIKRMEIGAGYKEVTVKLPNKEEEFLIYIYDHDVREQDKIQSGDWTKR